MEGEAGTLPVRIVSVNRGEKAPTGEEVLAQWLTDSSSVDGVKYGRWLAAQDEFDDEDSLARFGECQQLLEELKGCLGSSFQELMEAWKLISVPDTLRRFYYQRDTWAIIDAEMARQYAARHQTTR